MSGTSNAVQPLDHIIDDENAEQHRMAEKVPLRRSASVPDLTSTRLPSHLEPSSGERLSLATLFERSLDIWRKNVESAIRSATTVSRQVVGEEPDGRSQRWQAFARDLDNTLFQVRLWAQDVARAPGEHVKSKHIDVYDILDALERAPNTFNSGNKMLAEELAGTCRELHGSGARMREVFASLDIKAIGMQRAGTVPISPYVPIFFVLEALLTRYTEKLGSHHRMKCLQLEGSLLV
jgi:hypothetical protein